MKRNHGNVVLSLIAAAVVAFTTGCASVPSAETAADAFEAEVLAEANRP